jgi:hypothetical protein
MRGHATTCTVDKAGYAVRLPFCLPHARNIRDGLSAVFGPGRVFMDIGDLAPGLRFDEQLDRALRECKVLIVVIGPRWLKLMKARASAGERDYVCSEIAAALKRTIPVIPVYGGRQDNMPSIPKASALPESIRALLDHQKINIAHETYTRDINDLVSAIKKLRVLSIEKWRLLARRVLLGSLLLLLQFLRLPVGLE